MRNNLLQDKVTFRKRKNRMLHHHLTLPLSNTLLAIAVLDRMVGICGYISFAKTVTF